ncbi:MAG TPA: terminase large subunit [Candidatus Saccharimonadales bacterium]
MQNQTKFRFQDTTATRRVFQLSKRIRAVAGGTSASKTISILVWLIDYCQTVDNKLSTVVSESYPHLEKGAMLDFENIMKDRNYWDEDSWHATKHIYTFPTGSKIEFFSVDTYGKAHGPRRDVLFMNECNNLDYKIADQLITRTREIVWMDWNPTNEFWFYTELQPNRTDIDFITLTYKDNEALDQVTINEIEGHRHNKNWWRVYGQGLLGEVEGRIFTNWALIDHIPHEARLERRGLDFGYSNDPTALIDVYYYNGGFILDERIYRKGLTNKQIADYILNDENPNVVVFADSAEPKSIDEIRSYGVTMLPAQKGPGSITQGISYIQDQQIAVTKRSTNLIHEYRNYMWETDKDGKIINKPMDMFNHGMDALRYALETYMRASTTNVGIVTSTPERDRHESFVVNDQGEAEAWHIDIGKVVKENVERQWL